MIVGCEILAPLEEVNRGDGGITTKSKRYQVGPTREYKMMSQVAPLLEPGDVVEVDGDFTYEDEVVFTKHGRADAKIVLKGLRVNGKRPVLKGGNSTVHLLGHHYVFEGFEVTTSFFACILHQADDILVRDAYVHDCQKHGVLGADSK